jgi:hypothetical protein
VSLVSQLWQVEMKQDARERDFTTTCPTCERSQRLDGASVDQTDPHEVVYSCRFGCGPVLIVSAPGTAPWEGRGYRMGDWVVRNPTDLFFQPSGAQVPVKLPASPAAFD